MEERERDESGMNTDKEREWEKDERRIYTVVINIETCERGENTERGKERLETNRQWEMKREIGE
jgi:hypothetical protein